MYFSSSLDQKYASVELRRHFAREKITKTSVRDIFEQKGVELAKKMTRLGFQMKRDRTICKFCVSNIHGSPAFFYAGQDQRYSEMDQRTL